MEFVKRFVQGSFSQDKLMTVGMEPFSKNVCFDGNSIILSIWVVNGEDRFKVMSGMFFRNTDGAFIFYDITNRTSFENVDRWIQEIRSFEPQASIILVGNKNDLIDQREVTIKEGEEKANKLGLFKFIETSVLSGENIEDAFLLLAKKLVNPYAEVE